MKTQRGDTVPKATCTLCWFASTATPKDCGEWFDGTLVFSLIGSWKPKIKVLVGLRSL